MEYVFGPVPSRRLGQSLGIDTVPLKTCNWNCAYCQLGRSVPVTNQRKEYVPREEVLAEVRAALAAHKAGEIDWVTFVASGEPTLDTGLGWLIGQLKGTIELPVAVITNGALFYMPEVREEVSAADAVLPSLDAGNAVLYRKLNRPHPEVTFERLVDGLIAFRGEYQGKLWVEVMLVRGMNDTEQALREIAAILDRVRPDEIHINLPTRPPAERWVRPPDEEGLMRALAILGERARVVHPAEGAFDLSGSGSIVDAIVGIITRHPMREEELLGALENRMPGQAAAVLQQLVASGRAQVVDRYGVRFWSASPARFPNARASQGRTKHRQERTA
jgi:wyosine [tRNA(Phe)-imidazoG37] synthetase (radical SAM superfamily)